VFIQFALVDGFRGLVAKCALVVVTDGASDGDARSSSSDPARLTK
jgi:hypothetical protein